MEGGAKKDKCVKNKEDLSHWILSIHPADCKVLGIFFQVKSSDLYDIAVV